MPIERAVFHSSAWQVFWTAPGASAPPPPPNGPPVASFTTTISGTTVSFNGSASHGTGSVAITSYLWDFGDGKKSSASPTPTASHTYATAGTFTVNLTVTAADKQTASASATVKISITNKPPIAAFSTSVSGLTVAFNASTSSDSDGQIASYAWNFGDGATASGVTVAHAYTSGGTKNVSLTVTDNLGGTGVASKSVVLSTVPIADFTFSVSGNTVSVDASPTVATNPISSYTWDWGDPAHLGGYSTGPMGTTPYISLTPGSTGADMQCCVRVDATGRYFATQPHTEPDGHTQSTRITRMDSSGNMIDQMVLNGAGHGTSIGIEYISGIEYVWVTWSQPSLTNTTVDNNIVRFPWPSNLTTAGTRYDRSAISGLVTKIAGPTYRNVQFDWRNNLAVLRISGGTSDTYQLHPLSNIQAGNITSPQHTVTLKQSSNFGVDGYPTMQGFSSYKGALFRYTGAPSDVVGGDPVRLTAYQWTDGSVLGTLDLSTMDKAGGVYPGGKGEPEGATLYNSNGAAPKILAGLVTGPPGAHGYDMYSLSLNPSPGGFTGKTASHTYETTGTYNVLLTVKDTVGQTDTQTKAVTIGGTVNKPPVASFVSAATNLTANLNGSGSTDSDGTIVSYAWDFGDGATGSGQTTSHTYSAAGTFTVSLTVTDNAGAKGSVSHAVSVSAAPASGLGDGGGSGITPSGSGITSWDSLSGSDFSKRCNAAGSNKVALPSGTYTFSDFSISGSGGSMALSSFWFGAKLTTGGILGAGSKYTTITMVANTSTKASTIPTASGSSNNLNMVFIDTPGAKVDGVKIVGSEQGHLYSGLRFNHVSNPVLTNATIAHIPGNSGSPPGETTGIDFQGCTGTVTITNVTGDGGGVTAAMFESNNADCTYNITNLYTHDHPYSAGWASWEHKGIMNFHNYVMRKGARAFNAERIAGVVNFYDPLWDQATGTHSDLNPTYETGWTGGTINFYFSSTSAWNNFIAPRTLKKITAITNPSSVSLGLNKATVIKVYINGALQTQSDYVHWN